MTSRYLREITESLTWCDRVIVVFYISRLRQNFIKTRNDRSAGGGRFRFTGIRLRKRATNAIVLYFHDGPEPPRWCPAGFSSIVFDSLRPESLIEGSVGTLLYSPGSSDLNVPRTLFSCRHSPSKNANYHAILLYTYILYYVIRYNNDSEFRYLSKLKYNTGIIV